VTMSKNHLLVFGATGAQGAPVAEHLLAAGNHVRCMLRHPERAEALRQQGAEIVAGDIDHPDDLNRAMQDVSALYAFAPFGSGGNPVARIQSIFAAARAAGVQMAVLNTSGQTPREPTGDPMRDFRLALEATAANSGVPTLVLRPWIYLENLLGPWVLPALRDNGELAYPLPMTHRVSWVTSDDIGALAAYAIAHPELAGQAFDVGGTQALTGDELAGQISRGLGKPVRYRAQSPNEFADIMAGIMGPQARDGVASAYRATASAPSDVLTVDTTLLLRQMPVALTPVETWARARLAPALAATR
jgi:uncharacterized protein YbjT (DUF2867 family)